VIKATEEGNRTLVRLDDGTASALDTCDELCIDIDGCTCQAGCPNSNVAYQFTCTGEKHEELVGPQADAAETIKDVAMNYGIPVPLALGLADLESDLKHTTPSGDVKTNGNEYGIMQINRGQYPECFDAAHGAGPTPCGGPRCSGKTALDEGCNIEAGQRILSILYETYKDGIPPPEGPFVCSKKYTGWDAALRAYDGLSPDCSTQHADYVELVKARARKYEVSP